MKSVRYKTQPVYLPLQWVEHGIPLLATLISGGGGGKAGDHGNMLLVIASEDSNKNVS